MTNKYLSLSSLLFVSIPHAFAADEVRPCGTEPTIIQEIQDQCEHLEMSNTLKNEPKIEPAMRACVNYFQKVYQSRDLLCEERYRAMQLRTASHAATLNTEESLGNARSITEEAREAYRGFASRMTQKRQEVEQTENIYIEKLNALITTGLNCMSSENWGRTCRESQVSGIFLYGIGKRSTEHALEVGGSVMELLQTRAAYLTSQASQAQINIDQLTDSGSDLTTLVPEARRNRPEGEAETISDQSTPLRPGRTVSGTAGMFGREGVSGAARGMAVEGAERLNRGLSVNDVIWAAWKLACRRAVHCWVAEELYSRNQRSAVEFRNFCRSHLAANRNITSAEMARAWKDRTPAAADPAQAEPAPAAAPTPRAVQPN